MANRTRISDWYTVTVCKMCMKQLSYKQLMYSTGTCPYCGNNNRSTLVASHKIVIRCIRHYPWWQLFDRVKTYEGKDKRSQDWLDALAKQNQA